MKLSITSAYERLSRIMKPLGTLFLAAACLYPGADAFAHGGVPIEEDSCVFALGTERVHFSAYQPDSKEGSGKELCRQLPAVSGRTFLVFDVVGDELRDADVELAIVPDGDGHPNSKREIAKQAIAYRVLNSIPTGTVSIEHDFTDRAGLYRAVMMRRDGDVVSAGISFEVGRPIEDSGTNKGNIMLISVLLLLGGLVMVQISRRRKNKNVS